MRKPGLQFMCINKSCNSGFHIKVKRLQGNPLKAKKICFVKHLV